MRPEKCGARYEKYPHILLHENVQNEFEYLDYANEMRHFLQ